MVGRGIAIAAHAVAAVANHHFYRELAHLGVALAAHTAACEALAVFKEISQALNPPSG